MKKLWLIGLLLLCACDNNVSQRIATDKSGKVTINGKDCEVVAVNAGDFNGHILFVDCGPGSSSTTFPVGKQTVTVGQYIPPVSSGCVPPDALEELRKYQEIKKLTK